MKKVLLLLFSFLIANLGWHVFEGKSFWSLFNWEADDYFSLKIVLIGATVFLLVFAFFFYWFSARENRLRTATSEERNRLKSESQQLILEQRHCHERNKQIQQDKELAEKRYNSVFFHAQDALFVMDSDGRVHECNPTFARLIFNHQVPAVFRIDDLIADEEVMQQWLQSIERRNNIQNWEWLALSKQTGSLWVSLSGHWICHCDKWHFEGRLCDITEQVLYQEQLKYKAAHDSLTDLWNRHSFLNEVAVIAKGENDDLVVVKKKSFALLYIDIDRFKLINDSLGHQLGDKVLMEVAQQLRMRFGHIGEIARLGGDEFAILVATKQLAHSMDVEVASLLIQLTKPMRFTSHSITISASIGIRQFNAGCHIDAQRLLHDADLAMEEAKRRGKNGFFEFSASMAIAKNHRLAIEQALNQVNVMDEFSLVYQPIYDIQGSSINGFEALIRWHNVKLGAVSPAEFIPIAEESGKILKIGEWVCLEVFRFLSLLENADVFVSVNVAPLQLEQPDFVSWFIRQMKQAGVSPNQIKLEVTETGLMSATHDVTESLEWFLEHEIEVYIDDFGTGHSSLARLKSLPATGIKIDKAFVDEIALSKKANQLIGAITAIAENFQLTVTVEGIEDEAQHKALRTLYCHQCQGYWFSKPMDPEAALALLQKPVVPSLNATI
ncbi:diguanylate cyclase/phosphodiesterase (GGDEF & EAL domains) with PAS/PAC sensor(s) [Pseudoalteromonas luteoviolacea B = ATCC 29581]|nr:diguanylate cyclase/phosphodiesterase (GGDEF & EAL domains) with PAS/PAC sensor(s) [Pseudoalteromonas luteoviolacea B = ATCC 29581]